MKLFIALFCVATVVAVPIAQIATPPGTEDISAMPGDKVAEPVKAVEQTAVKVEEPAAKCEGAECDAKVEAKAEEPAAEPAAKCEGAECDAKVEAKAEEPAAEPAAKVEAKLEAKCEGAECEAEAKAKAEADPAKLEEIKEQALNQVMSFISDMAQPMTHEEHSALKDIITQGGDVLMQAEKKANQIKRHIEDQSLIQSGDGLFGIREDGSVDADAAATQVTEFVSAMASTSNPLTKEEKDVLHDLISGFAHVFAPSEDTSKDLEKLATQFASKVGEVAKEDKDQLLHPQTLLSVFHDNKGFDTNLLSDLTEKFLDRIETHLDTAVEAIKRR